MMKLRAIVLILAGIGIPLSVLAMLLPITWGYGGYNWRPDGATAVVIFVDPNGPAARAGLRVGDRVHPASGYDGVVEMSGNVGEVVHERVIRDGRERIVNIPFVPFFGSLAAQELFNKLLFALTAACAFLVSIIVVLRARDADVGARAAIVLVLAGFGAFCQAAALVCGSAWLAFAFVDLVPPIIVGLGVWAALSLLAIYPPDRTELRRALSYAGIAAIAWGLLGAAVEFYAVWDGTWTALTQPFLTAGMNFLFYAVMCVAIVDAMMKAQGAHAAPMRWLGGMWLLGIAFGASTEIAPLAGLSIAGHYGDILRAANVFCVAFGVVYPVLRHRLVDLNILISRATIFGIVSAIIVALFIAAEWAIGKIFEASVGLSSDHLGMAAQLSTLAVVLVLGISARSIHGFVEERLTKTFFRKRIKGLDEIQRVAREADAATDAQAVMNLAVETVHHCLECLGAAFYLCRVDYYERVSAAGALSFPALYAFNDAAPLRLRRWQEPFEIDDDSDERNHMLFIPMTLRGEVLGFLCCGPKPDRTAYLSDEIAALSLLAHHTGIASAWLSRMAQPIQVVTATTQPLPAG
ncbi:MAG TPA: hypothetical protein VFH72_13885 [Candidatus Baltobacteraceae bacterium]|nr:hypothetical protein [Candidatus Baltobacteraceae bacterium]